MELLFYEDDYFAILKQVRLGVKENTKFEAITMNQSQNGSGTWLDSKLFVLLNLKGEA